MAHFVRLTVKQKRFIAAIAVSRTVAEAAAASEISERTAHRWLQEPNVRLAIQEVQESILRAVTRQAVEAMGEAVRTLRDVMLDTEAPPGNRVSAARAVLEHVTKLHQTMGVAARLAALEQAAAEIQKSASMDKE